MAYGNVEVDYQKAQRRGIPMRGMPYLPIAGPCFWVTIYVSCRAWVN